MLVTLPDVPRGKNAILTHSGFFRQGRCEDEQPASHLALPAPAVVREECIRQHGVRARNLNRPPPVRFPALGLLVKFGYLVSEAEAQCMLLVRKYLPTVPVPEVYGWLHDGTQCFIYMELLEGETLEDCWDDLSEDDKRIVCQQLRGFVATWRLPQTLFASEPFIGSVTGESLLDWIFVNSCDWQQSGWYPAYWEYNKARWAWSKKAGDTWWRTYLPTIMETAKFEGECWDYWDYFISARGM